MIKLCKDNIATIHDHKSVKKLYFYVDFKLHFSSNLDYFKKIKLNEECFINYLIYLQNLYKKHY